MSGKLIYNNRDFSRRSFLYKGLMGTGALALSGYFSFKWWKKKGVIPIPCEIRGASSAVGHLLRNINFELPAETEKVDYLIVGAGISGLSAARWLSKNGIQSYKILELEPEAGGNSSFGKNEVSAYPLGAHYIPLPNNDLPELAEFLTENEVISGFDINELPIYNEYFLCSDPEERLYIHNHWQEGLVPNYGVPKEDMLQIKAFLQLVNDYRNATGTDHKPAFSIPLDRSSADAAYRKLDEITIKQFMEEKGFTSTYLQWYIDYCCRDDYGSNLLETSAWAGIHYFAARKGKASNAASDDVITWPEGNGRLMEFLKKDAEKNILKNSLAFSVQIKENKVQIDYFDVSTNAPKRIEANKCIMATPQFVNQRIVKSPTTGTFSYSPWMVANITVNKLSEKKGRPLSWDNVIYGSRSLGYVCANHQDISLVKEKQVLTYYLPLSDKTPAEARQEALRMKKEEWTAIIINDLKKVHKDIEEHIENIEIWLWGHGMIRPVPGFLWGIERANAAKPIENKIFFAHSDLGGISIFEEAFYQGIKAVRQCVPNSI